MYIKIKVKTNQKEEEIVKKSDTHFIVSVREKPERNLSNKKIIELISAYLNLPIGKVKIVSGHHSPGKIVSLDIDS